ncbi:MAG: erythromycin esterase family protein [Solirubrobacterales bacterium]|nr:erythromycin esterase family protein [Solirubrobacterales bacterium]
MNLSAIAGSEASAIAAVDAEARPVTGAPGDYDELIDQVGDARVVMIGEATHGTHEFYRHRAVITKRLIEEKGFTAVAVEADWPDAYRVNRWVHGADDDPDAERALAGFERFPTWMWRNADVLDFVGWLRSHNERADRPTGFYGLDLYSLYRSIEAVVAYLDKMDPPAAARARERYACLERFEESQAYGYSAARGLTPSCRQGVVRQLIDLRNAGDAYLRRDGIAAEDEQFYAEENARLVVDAEEYYRSMFTGPISSWNLRDSHMAGTLERLISHLEGRGEARTVVWAHNSHIGDARRTSMGRRGEHNIGQLARERFGLGAVLIGFTTCTGTVSAASDWGAGVERKRVRPPRRGSIEALFGEADREAFWLRLRDDGRAAGELFPARLERAIGVIYRPENELVSHYFEAHVSEQFDYVIHFDETRAVEPLERTVEWKRGEPPETYPTSL